VCFECGQRALVKPTATPSVLPGLRKLGKLETLETRALRALSTALSRPRRFSFPVCARLQLRLDNILPRLRLPLPLPRLYYCTAAWKPFASCFIAVPCDCLPACLYHRLSLALRLVPHFAARPACLRVACYRSSSSDLTATASTLPVGLHQTLPAIHSPTLPPSQPSRTVASAARIPSIHLSHSTRTLKA